MRLSHLVAAITGDVLFLAPRIAFVDAQDALRVQPSDIWYGIDGNWSAFTFAVGTPGQSVNLLLSTTLSETWVVEDGGCAPVQACYTARGGVFNSSASSTWNSLGEFSLGVTDLEYGGNGDYGFDTLSWTNGVSQTTQSIAGALIGGINSTAYYEGVLGLGATPGNFSNLIGYPVIQQLVQDYGIIPSYSYGFTAGAYYVDDGVPASLTFGGYDELRFDPYSTNFTLDPDLRYPTVLLRGITTSVASMGEAPSTWTSTSQALMNESLIATIDTVTPFLWLPPNVCDSFASALDLTWSDELGVYTMSEQQYTQYQSNTSLSFTFSLSSYDNGENFGHPLDAPNVINITVSANAFAQALSYPFGNISYGGASVPYFPLARSNGSFVIGRAFFQEAYMIMHYESAVFSLHQALFPEKAATNYSLQTIPRLADSGLPGYVGVSTSSSSSSSSSSSGLSKGAVIGIVLGAAAFCSCLAIATIWCWCRRYKRSKSQTKQIERAETESVESDLRSPVRRMFSVIIRRRRSRRPPVHEVHGSTTQPVEVGADAHHEVYELPAPHAPAEMDGNVDGDGEDDVMVLGSEGERDMSSYEQARRKLGRQLRGPVPTYSPPPSGGAVGATDQEKSGQDVSPVAHYRSSDLPSQPSPVYPDPDGHPLSSRGSLPSLPSPLSPVPPDWTNRAYDLPSPLTIMPPRLPSPRCPTNASDPSPVPSPRSPHPLQTSQGPQQPEFDPSPISRSNSSSNVSPVSSSAPGALPLPPPTAIQRTPIDPSRVICLGPLPDNVQLLRHQPSIPRLVMPDGRLVVRGDVGPEGRLGSVDSLGSNFTADEEDEMREMARRLRRRQEQRQRRGGEGGEEEEEEEEEDYPRSPHSLERIETSAELVHVPQVADKRYSWEDTR